MSKVPKHYIGIDFGLHVVGLQRTCKLVDEWSDRHNAQVVVRRDELPIGWRPSQVLGGIQYIYREIDRRYREVVRTPEAAEEAEWIYALASRRANGANSQVFEERLRERGYSEAALAESFEWREK